MLRIHGVKNAGQSNIIREKVKRTCLTKYGFEHAMSSPELQKRSKEGCFKKYGVTNVFSSGWCIDKIKKFNLENHGVEHNMQVSSIRDKRDTTCIKKYGAACVTKNTLIKKKISNTHLRKVYSKLETERIKPLFSLSNFHGFQNKLYKFQCKKCNNIFENNYIGVRCYRCQPLPRSKIEEQLSIFLNSIVSEVKRNARKEFDNEFEIDFYIPNRKLAIELNGNYYHSELSGKSRDYHVNKTEKCEAKGIHLIQIMEDEWINKQEIVKDKILHLLKNNSVKVYARKCDIKPVSYIDAKVFSETNHIQGSDISPVRIGLYHNEILVALMTFGKLRKIMGFKKSAGNKIFELSRYSTSKGLSVPGGASKLLSYFKKIYQPEKIISYADRRWSNSTNNMYNALGFEYISKSQPNYWYVHSTNYLKRFHRFSFRKSILSRKLGQFDTTITEWENMKNNKYDRIWDCGNLRYEWSI